MINRVGYRRIPNFGPALPAQTVLPILDAEIAFFRANTDGLVVDISRNTGGGCIGLDHAARLIPNKFWFFGEQMRPTQSLIFIFEINLANARAVGAGQWIIDTYQAILTELKASQKENRAMTGSFPACTSTLIPTFFRRATFENDPFTAPNGQVLAYEKPIIFPAMMQDNQRGPIVGMRTAGYFAEATATNTNSLS